MAFLDSQGVSKLCALLKDKFDNVMSAVNRKQDALTAGANITINDGVISADGGSDYTAGNGIDIDANGVISKSLPASVLFGLWYCIEANNTNIYNSNTWITTFLGGSTNGWALDNATGREKHIKNLKTFGMTYLPQGFNGDNNGQYLKQIISAVGGDDITTSLPIVTASNANNTQYTTGMSFMSFDYSYMSMLGYQNKPVLIIFDGSKSKGSNYRWYFIGNPEKVFQNKYFNSVSGLTSHSIPQAIDEVATNLNTRVPSGPSTDGTYKLTSTITSGTPTYSWETDSGSSGGNVNLTYGEYGIPIGLFYNTTKGYQSPYFARTPAILQLSAAPSARELASGQFIKTTNINNESTYNTVDIFPDATTNTCYKIQVKRDGIDWTNAQTISTSVGATFNLTFYGRGTIRVGNVIFYWLSRDQWSSNSNSVYDEDALQMIREELFPELFTSSSSSSLPAAPSADGNYILKCSVSSGTPTYSWESVTVGGSY